MRFTTIHIAKLFSRFSQKGFFYATQGTQDYLIFYGYEQIFLYLYPEH